MMLYQNRIFVATPEVYDLSEHGGFVEVSSEQPVVPRVFVPLGTKIYEEPVTRMGVLGIYSMQKAIHHWFTADRDIEVTEGDWLEAIPPFPDTDLNIMTMVIFETATKAYATILSRGVPPGIKCTSAGLDSSKAIFTMQLVEVHNPNILFTDSMLVSGEQFSTFKMTEALSMIPAVISGQMLLHMFNLLESRPLLKWEVSETDASGVNEIPIKPCTAAQIDGYAKFLNTPAPSNTKLYS